MIAHSVWVITLAVDVGAYGALAWLDERGNLLEVDDMPSISVRGKQRVSAPGLAAMMKRHLLDRVVVEGTGAFPGQGVASSFAFGYASGLVEGVVVGLGYPVEIIQAAVWKKRANVPKDKGAVRQMAQRAWPLMAERFALVKHDGRADAALLGRWYATGRTDAP